LLSNDYTSSAAELRNIEGRLPAYRILERMFALNESQSIAVYAVLIILTLYALLASGLARRAAGGKRPRSQRGLPASCSSDLC
jgi:hypothetical protein